MSSWQQALSEDFRKGKKRDTCPVVMNRNQEKNLKTGREDPDEGSWVCQCGNKNLGFYYRCEKCQSLRPEERATRLEMRAREGEIGRGGGFFQRPSADDRKSFDSDGEEFDDFGRRKRKSKSSTSQAASKSKSGDASATARTDARELSGSERPKADPKAERQKAALARLHAKGRGSRASRSRSRSLRRR